MNGKNVEMSTEGDVLIIRVDLTKRFGRSRSGKTEIVATTGGNISVPGHEDVKLGLNLYTR